MFVTKRDGRREPVQFDKISARALTDAHRRALCACAAYTLSLGYELWAKEEVAEAGAAPVAAPVEAKAKPIAVAKPESIAEIKPGDMPLDEDEYGIVIGLLSEVHKNAPEKITSLTKAFRTKYGLDSKAALSKEIKTQEHVEFVNAFLSS